MEQRWANRKATDVAVRFLALPDIIGVGRVTSISLTGAFIATKVDLPQSALLYLETIQKPQARARRQRLAANVVRRTSEGVGIEWREPAFNSSVYAQLRALSRDIGAASQPAQSKPNGRSDSFFYRFDFLD